MFSFALLVLLAASCGRHEATPANTGNATDRSPINGTSGTGTPANISTMATDAALGLTTAGGTDGQVVGITGTQEVDAARTETTSTIVTPTTTTAAVSTPTDTSSTIKTTTGAKTTRKGH